jgi:hypothetical protein
MSAVISKEASVPPMISSASAFATWRRDRGQVGAVQRREHAW